MKNKKVVLDGSLLSISDLSAIVGDEHVGVAMDQKALQMVKKTRSFVEEEMGRTVIYGVNTGLGPMANRVIGKGDLESLQKNLIRSHSTGAGDPIADRYVLAAMVVRLNTLVKGYSGVSPEILERLRLFIQHRIIPVVPEHGAVGTSGDLVQLAHIALALIGEGEVRFREKKEKTKTVLRKLSIAPTYTLKAKEGLSLINGTSMMSGIGALLVADAKQALHVAIALGAFALELVQARSDMYAPRLQEVRPHPGQNAVAMLLASLLSDSGRIVSRKASTAHLGLKDTTHEIEKIIQEIYSLRCIPQIVGPVYDALEQIETVVEREINSATDNPIIDIVKKEFLHGGNFHGEYIAEAMDRLKEGVVKLTILSERRLNYFLVSRLNGAFPPFLNLKTPGHSLGLQGMQFVATSTTAGSQSLAYPHRIHSISTNADNQDVVSMGTDAALMTAKVLENCWTVFAIEAIALAQAADCLVAAEGRVALKTFSSKGKKMYEAIRAESAAVTDDRPLSEDIKKVMRLLRSPR